MLSDSVLRSVDLLIKRAARFWLEFLLRRKANKPDLMIPGH